MDGSRLPPLQSCRLWCPHPSNSPTSSRHHYQWRRWTFNIPHPQRTLSPARFPHSTSWTVLHMHNCIYTTHIKPSNIGCNGARHLTRSLWSFYKPLSRDTTVGLRTSSMLRRFSSTTAAKIFQYNSQSATTAIDVTGTLYMQAVLFQRRGFHIEYLRILQRV